MTNAELIARRTERAACIRVLRCQRAIYKAKANKAWARNDADAWEQFEKMAEALAWTAWMIVRQSHNAAIASTEDGE